MNKFNIVVIAPHPDDELIGCFTLLRRGAVKYVYFLDVDTMEFERSAEEFKFKVVTDFSEVLNEVDVILVPDPCERHPLHKEAYVFGRKLAIKHNKMLGLYSTEMTASYVDLLPKQIALEKRAYLDLIYPSKADMWRYEHKYWLYEGVVVRI